MLEEIDDKSVETAVTEVLASRTLKREGLMLHPLINIPIHLIPWLLMSLKKP